MFENKIPQDVLYILKCLNNKFEAYIVGGCVRDLLLDREPHDWDICTSAKPQDVIDVVYLSTVTLEEIEKCPEPKQTKFKMHMNEIKFTVLDITKEVADVASKIIEMGILTKKSYDDCRHIGAAIVNECDCILSWNFKHIVNIKTIHGVRAITSLDGYKSIEIWNPSVLLESEE